MIDPSDYVHLIPHKESSVLSIELNRPEKANALDEKTWLELGQIFRTADQDASIRCVIVTGSGSNFCAGIDFSMLQSLSEQAGSFSEGRKQEFIRDKIKTYQDCFTAIENCRKPVIAAIQGACFGAGVDLISACDIRYATTQASFCVKELDLAIVADVGTIQRLPKIIGEGRAREMAFTATVVSAADALSIGLVTDCFSSKEKLMEHVHALAKSIAEKSPLAVRGTKQMFNYSRDHNVQDGLDMVATWNAAMLLSEDLQQSVKAMMSRNKPIYED